MVLLIGGVCMDSVLKIALGVFIGALAAMFAWEGVQAARLEYAAAKLKEEVRRSVQQQRQRDAEAARARADQAARETERVASQQRVDAARRDDLERRKVAREEAWSQFFKRSAKCSADSGSVDCANEYMRARKRFDEVYRD